MENPATWGPLEHAIDKAITQHLQGREKQVVGLSLPRTIADAVRGVYGSGPSSAPAIKATGLRVTLLGDLNGRPNGVHIMFLRDGEPIIERIDQAMQVGDSVLIDPVGIDIEIAAH